MLPETIEEITDGFEDEEIEAIRKGVLVTGMRKASVWVCYGPPPEHATPSRQSDVWTYWTSRFVRKRVFFDEQERVARLRIHP